MVNERKILVIEYMVITLLWTLVVTSPLIFVDEFRDDWRAIHIMWAECIIVGMAFLINRFLLIPLLFFTKQYIAYILSVVGLLGLICIFIVYFDGVGIFVSICDGNHTRLSPQFDISIYGGFDPLQMPPVPMFNALPPTVKILTVSLLIMALDLGIRISTMWVINEQKQAATDQERVVSQLQNLQSQVSPHFLMNVLNNIHALVDIDPSRAKQTIIELSDLMSYLLYDCSNTDRVLLNKELDFITNYVNLMRLRFSKQVKINLSFDGDLPPVKIPPLLFLNFIENAFKYGVDYDKESIINIKFVISDTHIEMNVLNSNHPSTANIKKHGLGISNSKRRLELIYGNRYTLDINEKEMIYFVTLKIPIQ